MSSCDSSKAGSEPTSSPEITPPSSPVPPSSPNPFDKTPETSPLQSAPSSPVVNPPNSSPPGQRSPISSPYQGNSSSSSSSSPPGKRKRYEFADVEVPRNPIYWPQSQVGTSEKSFDIIIPDSIQSSEKDEETVQCISHAIDITDDIGHHYFGFSDEEDSIMDVSVTSTSDTPSSSDEEQVAGDVPDGEEEADNLNSVYYPSSDLSTSDSDKDSDDDLSLGSAKVSAANDLTVNEGVVILMDLFLTHRLEKKTLGNVLDSVLKFLPKTNNMPKSKYMLFKYVRDVCPPVPEKIIYYCQTCLYHVGEVNEDCPLCHSKCNRFFHLPLSFQIKNLFENHNLADIIDHYANERRNREELDDKLYSDITDGLEYQRARLPGKYDLTLMAHTDGVSVSKSSNVSLWPFEYVICEVPPYLRFKLLIIAGVWLDSCKPNMNCFLKPFIHDLKDIFETGVIWTHPKTLKQETTRVVAPVVCADAPVRAQVQNILSHGGRYCCNTCEQKMVKLPGELAVPGVKRRKRRRVFSWQEEPVHLRTALRMEAQGKVTRETLRRTGKLSDPKKGVKGKSVISKAPNCDRSTVVYAEYMHILIGVIKQFMHLWFETDGEWNLKEDRDNIDSMLEGIQVPDFVTRIPRSTDCYRKWKANEDRSFLLYYSLIVLSKCMSERYLQHWTLFVLGMYLLLQDVVSENDITRAEIMFRMFLRNFTQLYRASDFSYNLHNILHFGLLTRRWGPLWCNSAFQFENFNGSLSKYIHGSKNQGKEIINTIQLAQGVQVIKARCAQKPQAARKTTEFCSRVQTFRLSEQHWVVLNALNLKPESVYYRAVIDGKVYTCNMYKRQEKRNNFTICFTCSEGIKEYGEINCFFETSDENCKMMFVNCFKIEHFKMFTHAESGVVVKHIIPIKKTNEVKVVSTKNILFKVIRVGEYVCCRANKYEVNL